MPFLEQWVSSGEDGSALTNTTTATSILPGSRKPTLPNLYFDQIGKRLKLSAWGRISTAAATPGTLTLDVRFGSIIVASFGPTGTLATSATNLTWRLQAELVARSLGSGTSATVIGFAELMSAAVSASTPAVLLPASAPAAGTGFDSSSAYQIDLFATWSVASASNSITCHHVAVEAYTG